MTTTGDGSTAMDGKQIDASLNDAHERRPLVLVTNDDGYGASGIEAMVSELESWATVLVIAPADNQSACAHKFSFRKQLCWKEEGPRRFSLDGTPVDCVYVGIFGGERVSSRVPDLVVSGLNLGCNLGLDIFYSGTVAGAREAAIRGVPGIAVSAEYGADLERAARLCSRMAEEYLRLLRRTPNAKPVVVNVNVPAKGTWELCRTRLGHRIYTETVEFRRGSDGGEFLWLGGESSVTNDDTPGTDTHAVASGFVGVTGLPLTPQGDAEVAAVVDSLIEAVGTNCGV